MDKITKYKRVSSVITIDPAKKQPIRLASNIRSFDNNVDEMILRINTKHCKDIEDFDANNYAFTMLLQFEGPVSVENIDGDQQAYNIIDVDRATIIDKHTISYIVPDALRNFVDTDVTMHVYAESKEDNLQNIDVGTVLFTFERSMIDTVAENIPNFIMSNYQEIIDRIVDEVTKQIVDQFQYSLRIDENGNLIMTVDVSGTVTDINLGRVKGDKGDKGDNGFSPTIVVNDDSSLTITTIDGVVRTPVLRGKDGKNGEDGDNGISPIITVNEDTSLTIVDADGTKTTPILKGSDGEDGDNGISPIVTVNDDTSLTIVDADGTKTTPELRGPKGDTATYASGIGVDVDNDSGVISAKIDNTTIVIDANGNMSSVGGSSGGGDYSAGIATNITEDKKINVNTDSTTIGVNAENKLFANLAAYTTIDGGTDLNTLIAPGRYQINVTSNNTQNIPKLGGSRVSNLFYINVENIGTTTGSVRQTVFGNLSYPISSYNPIRGGVFTRMRRSESATWTDWVMLAGEVLGVDGRSITPDQCTIPGEYVCYFIGYNGNWLGWRDAPFHLRTYKMAYPYSESLQQVITRPSTGEQKVRYFRNNTWTAWVDTNPGFMTTDTGGIGKVGKGLDINTTGSSIEIGRINVKVDTETIYIDSADNTLKVDVENLCGIGTVYNAETNKIDIDMDYIRSVINNLSGLWGDIRYNYYDISKNIQLVGPGIPESSALSDIIGEKALNVNEVSFTSSTGVHMTLPENSSMLFSGFPSWVINTIFGNDGLSIDFTNTNDISYFFSGNSMLSSLGNFGLVTTIQPGTNCEGFLSNCSALNSLSLPVNFDLSNSQLPEKDPEEGFRWKITGPNGHPNVGTTYDTSEDLMSNLGVITTFTLIQWTNE